MPRWAAIVPDGDGRPDNDKEKLFSSHGKVVDDELFDDLKSTLCTTPKTVEGTGSSREVPAVASATPLRKRLFGNSSSIGPPTCEHTFPASDQENAPENREAEDVLDPSAQPLLP